MVLFDRIINAVRVLILEPHVRFGVVAQKLLQVSAHMVQPDRVDRDHAHAAGNLLVQGPHLVLKRNVALHQFTAAFVIRFPLGSQHEGPLRAIDELHAQTAFQLVHHLAGTRLRNAVFFGRAREASPADDIAKNLQGF